MSEEIYALRGATSVEGDDPAEIDGAVKELFEELLERNGLKEDELAFVLLSQTRDLKSRNAASALRRGGHCKSVPLFCVEEAETEGMMRMGIRMLLQVNHKREKEPHMAYLRRAAALRPDLSK